MAKSNEREAIERRAIAKRRDMERRGNRSIKIDMRESWTMEESESC